MRNFQILTIFLERSDSSKIYKHVSPNISSEVPYTAVENLDDSDSNIKTTPYSTEGITNNPHRRYADFKSTMAQLYSKNTQKSSYNSSKCGTNSRHSSSNSLSQKSQAECENLAIPKSVGGRYTSILSPDVFVQVDPLHYLMSKMEKLSILHSSIMKTELATRLQCMELPQCYIPYAKVIWAVFQCWSYLTTNAEGYMEELRARRSSNNDNSVSLPEEISSSYELSQLYSSDILNDREPARRLLFIFLDMSEDSIKKLKIQLRNVLNNWSKYPKPFSYSNYCVCYARAMFNFFEKELAFESIRRGIAEIKSKAPTETSNQIL